MFTNNEITSITKDVRLGVYYANVVCVSGNEITLQQKQISQPDAQTIQSKLKQNKQVYYGTQKNKKATI